MVLNAFNGLCMAIADSVPGVSGGTVAFILGFYDRFIDSLHFLFHGTLREKAKALRYLVNLGIGWGIGMASCVMMLSRLFEKNIYLMSSVFLGLTIASIPFVIHSEKKNLRLRVSDLLFLAVGCGLVVVMTILRPGTGTAGTMDFMELQPLQYIYIVLCGMVAISAMVLPGISGSTVLLIAGVYLPAITAVRELFHMQISVLPGILMLGVGVLAGVFISVPLIRDALVRHRCKMVYFITGSMAGSVFSIIMGPATLSAGQAPLSLHTLDIPGVMIGIAVLLGLELVRITVSKRKKDGEMVANES